MTDATAAGYTARAHWSDGKVAYTSHGHPSAAVAYAYGCGNALSHGGTAQALTLHGDPVDVTAGDLARQIPDALHNDTTVYALADLVAELAGPMRPGETFADHGERLDEAMLIRQAMWRAWVSHPALIREGASSRDASDVVWRAVHLLVGAAVLRRAEAQADAGRAAA